MYRCQCDHSSPPAFIAAHSPTQTPEHRDESDAIDRARPTDASYESGTSNRFEPSAIEQGDTLASDFDQALSPEGIQRHCRRLS
jgi:hypothetical protein